MSAKHPAPPVDFCQGSNAALITPPFDAQDRKLSCPVCTALVVVNPDGTAVPHV